MVIRQKTDRQIDRQTGRQTDRHRKDSDKSVHSHVHTYNVYLYVFFCVCACVCVCVRVCVSAWYEYRQQEKKIKVSERINTANSENINEDNIIGWMSHVMYEITDYMPSKSMMCDMKQCMNEYLSETWVPCHVIQECMNGCAAERA